MGKFVVTKTVARIRRGRCHTLNILIERNIRNSCSEMRRYSAILHIESTIFFVLEIALPFEYSGSCRVAGNNAISRWL